MQKYFTKEISQSIKVIVLGLAIGLGVSFVSAAWTQPVDGPAPACDAGNPGCDAPINVSSTPQSKGGAAIANATYNVEGTSTADTLGAFNSFFVRSVDGTPIGQNAISLAGKINVDLAGNSGANGRDAFDVKASSDNDYVVLRQNKPKFMIWDYAGNARGTLQAKKIELQDGTQGAGKVLTSDANGLSSWQDAMNEPTLITQAVTVPNSSTPDIIMMEESWADLNDNQSRSISCPADYAAIAVACDTNTDGGADTCLIKDKGGSYDYNGKQTSSDVGTQTSFQGNPGGIDYSYYGAIVSPANDDANTHVWLTCMRFRNYPTTTTNVGVALLSGTASWNHVMGAQGNNYSFARGNDGQSCASFLGVPGNQGRIQLRIGTTVAYTDKCLYKGVTTTYQVQDANYTNPGVAPYAENSPGAGSVSLNGNVYQTWRNN